MRPSKRKALSKKTAGELMEKLEHAKASILIINIGCLVIKTLMKTCLIAPVKPLSQASPYLL